MSNGTKKALPKRRWQMLALIALVLALLLPGLSGLPVIDRDEARYAQASVQMADSGDWLNIRFQDEARNKKPAGAYWAQTVMLKALSSPEKRQIWVQRLPSVLAGLLAVLMTYLGAVRMIGRQGALYAGGALALSVMFVFEGHIAKTDALLCASAAMVFAALAIARNPDPRAKWPKSMAWLFWIGLGAGIMIKGPIVPALAALSIITLWIWERDMSWAKGLLSWPAILCFFLIWVPWTIAIYLATNGTFFSESLGKDFGGKIVSAQESHPGPPGYHFGLIWLTLWPSCLFLIPGIVYAIKTVRRGREDRAAITKAMRLCFAWVVPFWVLIEIMPTKLPHYILPLFPALCVMIGAAIVTLTQVKAFPKSRFFSGLLFLIATAALIAALIVGQTWYGNEEMSVPTYAIIGAGGLSALIASFAMWAGAGRISLASGAIAGIILSSGAYGYILPNLEQLKTPERIAATIPTRDAAKVISPTFTEPSLLYHLSKNVRLGDQAGPLDMEALRKGRIILIDQKSEDRPALFEQITEAAAMANICLETSPAIDGFNYSKGDAVEIVKVKATPCPPQEIIAEEPNPSGL